MRVIGSILLWTWAVVLGFLLMPLGLVLFVVFNPWVDPNRRAMEFVNHLWGKGVLLMLPGIKVRVLNLERLTQAKEPYIICPNHYSYADIITMFGVLPDFKFIARHFLFYVPPSAFAVRMSGHIRQSQGEEGGAERVIEQSLAWLKRRVPLLVFPESTRSDSLRVLRFRQGPFRLAQMAGVKVLPVALSGTHHILPKGNFLYRFRGEVIVNILEPVEVVGDPKKIASKVRRMIIDALPPDHQAAQLPPPALPPQEAERTALAG